MERRKLARIVSAVAAATLLAVVGLGAAASFAGGPVLQVGEPHRAALHSVIEALASESFLTPP